MANEQFKKRHKTARGLRTLVCIFVFQMHIHCNKLVTSTLKTCIWKQCGSSNIWHKNNNSYTCQFQMYDNSTCYLDTYLTKQHCNAKIMLSNVTYVDDKSVSKRKKIKPRLFFPLYAVLHERLTYVIKMYSSIRPKLKYCVLPLQRPTRWNCRDALFYCCCLKYILFYLFQEQKVETRINWVQNGSDLADSQ